MGHGGSGVSINQEVASIVVLTEVQVVEVEGRDGYLRLCRQRNDERKE